jgi:hypothetical protein
MHFTQPALVERLSARQRRLQVERLPTDHADRPGCFRHDRGGPQLAPVQFVECQLRVRWLA